MILFYLFLRWLSLLILINFSLFFTLNNTQRDISYFFLNLYSPSIYIYIKRWPLEIGHSASTIEIQSAAHQFHFLATLNLKIIRKTNKRKSSHIQETTSCSYWLDTSMYYGFWFKVTIFTFMRLILGRMFITIS